MQHQRRRPPMTLSPVAFNNSSNRPMRQSSRSVPSTPSQCFGCSQPMLNPFISNVLDHLWHPECVRCFACRCVLNEQCYSREGKLYCKDDFIKKYIHRCFACQNLVKSDELIRRIRAGRIYHAECFVCTKCKRTLQDDDISELLKTNDATLNDLECSCQTCLYPDRESNETKPLSKSDGSKPNDNEISQTINGKVSPSSDTAEQKPSTLNNDTSTNNNHVDEQQSMEVDEAPGTTKSSLVSPIKEQSSPNPSVTVAPKVNGRQSKIRQSTGSNGSKRSPAKTKTTPVSRQKQTTVTERKRRSPATRSKAAASNNPSSSSTVQRRASNRRTAKTSRYRKRSFSSGSDEDESDDEDDADFSEEDNIQDDEQENARSTVVKNKPTNNVDDKKAEPEPEPRPTPTTSQQAPPPPPPPPPPATTANPSLISQAKMSEPLSLLSGLAANPMSISSIMKPDLTPSFMPPNFNPAFPNHAQFLPPGFPLQSRLPMPPPPPPAPSTQNNQPVHLPDSNRSSNSADGSDSDSLDRSPSPSQMDISTNVEPGTPARPVTPPKTSRQAKSSTTMTTIQKPSALSSLLEFGTLPPSTLGDVRPNNAPTNPFPFPFVTPGPGVPFSPQAAAGMATFYRPPFGVPPGSLPLDMTQSHSNSSKKKSDTADNSEIVSQNLLDDSSSSPSPKKKAKAKPRSKKAKTNRTEGENGMDEDNASSSPPPPPPEANKKKRKRKTATTDNTNTNDNDASNATNGNANNHPQHNFLAQMGLINAQFMQPPQLPPTSANGKTQAANSQQAQLAAMYSMAPHFAAYNAFPGAFNPAFAAAAYASGYPNPYGFHPAFTASPNGQPFPFMQPTPTNAPQLNNTSSNEDKSSSSAAAPEGRPVKSRKKSTANGEKKKPATPRANKKKSVEQPTLTDNAPSAENDSMTGMSATDLTSHVATTPESNSTPNKRRMSSAESEDFDDDQQQSQTTNGKSGNESDGSMDDGDRSLNTALSLSSSTAQEKKGARTTIKPQQLDVLCKAYDTCSKPNKPQREQLVAETGLSLRVIQVWFQNKRSKERKGKTPKEKDMPLDDDEPGEDSQPPSPPPPLPTTTTTTTTAAISEPIAIATAEI
ncbi:unnamed protein product [Rotaria socialis]|uniref:Uncharacterized protein n=2 Tax=Rotaria socialis TaxID=392032 RepID=A0A817L1A3_9BILA|nr:unnamed protein product [Rotaria socialis]